VRPARAAEDSQELTQTPAFLGIPYPWAVAILACLLLMMSAANTSTFGVFFKPIANEFGWSRTVVAGALSVRMLVMAILVTPIGYLADRYGPRAILVPCFIIIGTTNLLLARVTEIWHLYLVQGLLIGIALSGPFVCVLSIVGRWHKGSRGMALGIGAAGIGLTSVFFNPLSAKLIEEMGWRRASIVVGVIVLSIGIIGSLAVKAPPAPPGESPASRNGANRGLLSSWRSLPHLVRVPTFAGIALMILFFSAATQMMNTHFVNYATDAGIEPVVAATMMGVMGVATIAGRLVMGATSDRLGTRASIIACFVVATAGLMLVNWKLSTFMLWVAVVVFGFGQGGETPMVPGLVVEQFGTVHLATMFGAVLTGQFIGAALGPWVAGVLFDLTGSYSWPFALAVCFTVSAAVLAWRLRPASLATREKLQCLFEGRGNAPQRRKS